MRTYNFFQALVLSFYSGNFYRQVAQRWRGRAFWYTWLVFVILGIPLSYHLAYHGISNLQQTYIPQLPVLTINQGTASTNQPGPFFIKNAAGELVAIIDTQNQFTDFKTSEAQILVQKNQVLYKTTNNKIETEGFSQKDSFVLDHQSINHFADRLILVFAILCYFMILTVGYILRILFACLYGFFGLVFAKTMRIKLDYPAALALAVVTMIPITIIHACFTLAGWAFNYELLTFAILHLVYVYYAVRVNKLSSDTAAPN